MLVWEGLRYDDRGIGVGFNWCQKGAARSNRLPAFGTPLQNPDLSAAILLSWKSDVQECSAVLKKSEFPITKFRLAPTKIVQRRRCLKDVVFPADVCTPIIEAFGFTTQIVWSFSMIGGNP
jgi:hypothetical protein